MWRLFLLLSRNLYKAAFLSLILTIASCEILDKGVQMEKDPAFQLAILEEDITASPQGLGIDWQTAWPILQAAYPSQTVYVITEYDVDSYDWSEQVIILNVRKSKALLERFNITFDDCGMKLNNRECLCDRAFVIAYQGTPLYGGITLWSNPTLAASHRYPVIYPTLSDGGNITLAIYPYKSLSKKYREEDWYLIRNESIEDLFDELGKLVR
jgi:hypothetical protein